MSETMSSPFRTPSIFASNQQIPTQLYRRPSKSDRDGSKKARASKPKVKSGCITCKTRRVKCDETKPECVRCQKFGRRCDGYTPEPTPKSALVQPIQPRIPGQNASGSNFSILGSQDEKFYFQYFRDVVAYELPGYFDPGFWIKVVFREGLAVLPITYAIIAIAALRKSLDLTSNLQLGSFEEGDNFSHRQFAVTYYIKAIHALKEYVSESDSPQMRTALIACILFACFEAVQGNHTSSVQQLNEGLKLLQSYEHKWSGTETHAFVSPRLTAFHDHAQPLNNSFPIQDNPPLRFHGGFNDENLLSGSTSESLYTRGPLPEIVVDTEPSPAQAIENRSNETIGTSSYGIRGNGPDQDQYLWNFPTPAVSNEYMSDFRVGDEFEALQEETQVHLAKFPPARVRKLSPTASLQLANSSSQSPASTDTHSLNPSPRSTPAAGNQSAASSITTSTPPIPTYEAPIEDILIQTFIRIQGTGQAVLAGSSLDAESLNLESGIQKLCHQTIPLQFSCFGVAHKCWDFLWYRIQHFCCRVLYSRRYAPGAHDSPAVILDTYSSFVVELENFTHAFQPYLDAAVDSNGSISNAAVLLICIYHKIALITLSAVTSDSEMVYDSFTPTFEAIIRTAALLISQYPTLNLPRNPRFSFDVGIIIPLFTVAIKCRDSSLRREAIDLLARNPRTEGTWNSTICARVGQYIMELEEEGLNMQNFGSFNLAAGSNIPLEDPLLPPSTHHKSIDHLFDYPSPPHMQGFDMFSDTISHLDDANRGKDSYPTSHERSRSDAALNKTAAAPLQARLRYHSSAGLMSVDSENAIYAPASASAPAPAEQLPISQPPPSSSSFGIDPLILDPHFSKHPRATSSSSSSSWNVPVLEKYRVRVLALEWHVPERFVKVVCEKCVLVNMDGSREVRERIVGW